MIRLSSVGLRQMGNVELGELHARLHAIYRDSGDTRIVPSHEKVVVEMKRRDHKHMILDELDKKK